MAQKSKTLLQLLQQHHLSTDDHQSSQSEHSNFRHLIENPEKKNDNKLQKQIMDLFEQIKTTILMSQDQLLLCQIKKTVPINKDVADIGDVYQVIQYIGNCFSVIFQEKILLEQQIEEQKSREQCDYEEQLIKLEAEIRQHIRIEQQLKIYAENTQSKLEDAIKAKDEQDEEQQQFRQEYEQLYEQNTALNSKIHQQEQELQILRNEFNNYKLLQNQQRVLAKKDHNIENDGPQKHITVNLQLDRLSKEFKKQSNDQQQRVLTEPYEYNEPFQNKSRNVSQKKLTSKFTQQRVSTETNENEVKKKRSTNSHYDTSQMYKHTRLKTVQNVSQLLNQDLRRHLSNKSYQDFHKSKEPNKPKKQTSQHSDANRSSNNSVHSFRKHQHASQDIQQIPRPFSSVEQMDDYNYSVHDTSQCQYKDTSMDISNYSKQFGDQMDNQHQIKKLLQSYQFKHAINDNIPKKVLQEYKKRQTYNSKALY